MYHVEFSGGPLDGHEFDVPDYPRREYRVALAPPAVVRVVGEPTAPAATERFGVYLFANGCYHWEGEE